MSIQRFDLCGGDEFCGMALREEGDYVNYSDHIAALAAQRKEYLEFANDYAQYCWEYARENICPDMDFEQYRKHWLDNVRVKDSQTKEENNPNRNEQYQKLLEIHERSQKGVFSPIFIDKERIERLEELLARCIYISRYEEPFHKDDLLRLAQSDYCEDMTVDGLKELQECREIVRGIK